ncbi:Tim17-domain-containing protein [Mycena latifolia]|nr:Tim17-domain-containing protein [Mycena latifolia]
MGSISRMAKNESQTQPSSASSSSSNPTEYFRSATFALPETSADNFDHVATASELLMGAYDPAKLYPLADLGDKLDYLLLDDDKTSDLPGARLALGGAWGVRDDATRPLAVSNTRLRINSVLSSVTRRGTFIGNSAVRGKHDILGSMGTGASIVGAKPVLAAATFMSGVAGIWSYVKKNV